MIAAAAEDNPRRPRPYRRSRANAPRFSPAKTYRSLDEEGSERHPGARRITFGLSARNSSRRAAPAPDGNGNSILTATVMMAAEDDGRVLPIPEGGQRRALMPSLGAAAPEACVIDTPRPRIMPSNKGTGQQTAAQGGENSGQVRSPVVACCTAETPQPIGGRRHPCRAASLGASPARFQRKRWTQRKHRRRCTACQAH
jgi:hypothetical protein